MNADDQAKLVARAEQAETRLKKLVDAFTNPPITLVEVERPEEVPRLRAEVDRLRDQLDEVPQYCLRCGERIRP